MNEAQRTFVERTLGWALLALGLWVAGVGWFTAQDFARDYGVHLSGVERRDSREADLSEIEGRDQRLLESPIDFERLFDPEEGLFERGHALLRDWERLDTPTPEVKAERDHGARAGLIGAAIEGFLWLAGPALLLALPLWWTRRYLALRRS